MYNKKSSPDEYANLKNDEDKKDDCKGADDNQDNMKITIVSSSYLLL